MKFLRISVCSYGVVKVPPAAWHAVGPARGLVGALAVAASSALTNPRSCLLTSASDAKRPGASARSS